MVHWFDGPLAAFDTETTGVDVEEDRIVSAALVLQDTTGGRFRVSRWLVSPGIPVPPGATEVHGLTDDHLQRKGRWPAPVMEELAHALAEQCATRRPIVVMDAPFDLTLLDRELRRHRASSLAGYLGDQTLCVLDPRVLDRHLDHDREGRRTLGDLCELYGVELDGARDAAADAAASLELVRAMGRRYSAGLEGLTPPELHSLQAQWHAAQVRGPQARFEKSGTAKAVDPAWPLRPELPAAA
ncbi:exonuclease domain-containing protein [Streptomyces sp. NBC_01754]|uniref:exonuclease domain-containing protein n=1 Tax=Streptomyces sp. NBC_01754 TaxID=2975930 RepID=UPI002DDBCD3D|nr:exonuclease domain-containing protein [Streptomyces sp. NBC_01754]WSC91511.1 exonuclease domain-containing protein [Streptomyces sp. NBC_01754]